MATNALMVEPSREPVHGEIYRTRNDESLMVLGVRKERIFVEYADGRHGKLSRKEWSSLQPSPSRC